MRALRAAFARSATVGSNGSVGRGRSADHSASAAWPTVESRPAMWRASSERSAASSSAFSSARSLHARDRHEVAAAEAADLALHAALMGSDQPPEVLWQTAGSGPCQPVISHSAPRLLDRYEKTEARLVLLGCPAALMGCRAIEHCSIRPSLGLTHRVDIQRFEAKEDRPMILYVGDDWAEDHHDVHLMDESGERLAARRLPEGVAGVTALHELVAQHAAGPATS